MKLNYFGFKPFNDRYLITNEMGFYYFLSKENLDNLINERYTEIDSDTIESLKDRYFIFDQNDDVFVERAARVYRENKRYLFSATCLHIFVMTNACNMCCVYCQAQDSNQKQKGLMSVETAQKAVEIALQSPSRELSFEFQGGEPLFNYNVIKAIIEYTEERKNDKNINYSVVTNTRLITDDMLEFFKKYDVSLSTSLDGNRDIHDSNRPTIKGDGTYEEVIGNIKRIKEYGVKIGAIQTTTRKSLAYPKEIVDTYRKCGLRYIFIRPLTPLGYAKEHWGEIGYDPEEFLRFYKVCLNEIIQCNKDGYYISEGHASIFLRKILEQSADNYMELRSPCGAGVGQIVYYYDGSVYTCDEARMLSEMGLPDFRLGDVNDSYDGLMNTRVCRVTCQSSVLESIPQCCDCAYHPYCGVCPVINYAMEQNLYSRSANGYRCKIYKGILDILFEYLSDDTVMEIFRRWL